MGEAPVSILAQRRIEAAFAKGIYEEMAASIGAEAARGIMTRAIVKLAEETGAAMAKGAETGVAHFASLMELWRKDDALAMDITRQDATHFDFNVTRCRYAETYRDMGLGELGAVLSCNRDGAFCGGYDKRLKLTRTQTIMGGASHCDFRYVWDEAAG
ncbi:L-2-amino-thiazoline-4-carboxylic acid hydrolase [Rhodovarius lipocyclicus]|uniref:L-2-amino-thiazoline-4-carboxylic acid hydrolase n=1 Tax=Rhodovarius lipocyclicus TaxID=268410 RepID=UPI00135BB1CE|nr:L-2-amino-thiazoline-4-carboxylic acid hydrolase [Rhodovarius lipocyclicus]